MNIWILIASSRWSAALMVFIGLSMAGPVVMADDAKVSINNCNIQDGPCHQEVGGHGVTLDIAPRPVKAMADLTFKVSVYPGPELPRPPQIHLNMPAMDMGSNQVQLRRTGPGIYQGQGVIIRCRSGLRTWMAKVDIPTIGTVDFIFDVIY